MEQQNPDSLSLAARLNQQIHGGNPFSDFDAEGLSFDPQGWFGNTTVMDEVIGKVNPDCIIEVGSWKGASAMYLAEKLSGSHADCAVICIDTWLGSIEHWLTPDLRDQMMFRNGQPQLYRQFMTNMIHQGLDQYIVPMPMPSRQAAAILSHIGLKIPVVYIDGGHDFVTVSEDLNHFWPLVMPNGVLFGDDYTMAFPGLIKAVDKFLPENADAIDRFYTEGSKYVIQKK